MIVFRLLSASPKARYSAGLVSNSPPSLPRSARTPPRSASAWRRLDVCWLSWSSPPELWSDHPLNPSRPSRSHARSWCSDITDKPIRVFWFWDRPCKSSPELFKNTSSLRESLWGEKDELYEIRELRASDVRVTSPREKVEEWTPLSQRQCSDSVIFKGAGVNVCVMDLPAVMMSELRQLVQWYTQHCAMTSPRIRGVTHMIDVFTCSRWGWIFCALSQTPRVVFQSKGEAIKTVFMNLSFLLWFMCEIWLSHLFLIFFLLLHLFILHV